MSNKIRFIFIALLAVVTSSYGEVDLKENDSSNKTADVVDESVIPKVKELRFLPERTRFVDRVGNNFLYRGGVPIINKEIVLSEVLESMLSDESRKTPVNKELVAPSVLPEPNYFVDFSLLASYKPHEVIGVDIESYFFSKFPELGEFVYYDANSIFMKGAPAEKVGELVDPIVMRLRNILLKVEDEPRIVYVHCKGGIDRVGAIISGYAMRYLEYSFTDAFALNTTIGLRDPKVSAQESIKLYAKYLKDIVGIKTIGDIY